MKLEKTLKEVERLVSISAKGKELPAGFVSDAALSGGKFLRSRLFFEFSGRRDAKGLKIAAAIEMVHAATLIHDDILDGAKIRRGKTALYLKRGIPSSVLYGDYLFSRSFSFLSDAGDERLWREISGAMSDVIAGEMLQRSGRGDISLSKKQYFSIIRKKTGALFGAACKMGAVAGGECAARALKAYRFGADLGTAYQVIDDCVDYLEVKSGKSNLRDISNGVVTLPLIDLIKAASVRDRKNIKAIISRFPVPLAGIKALRNMMIEKGTMAESLEEAERYLARARKAFPDSETMLYVKQKLNDAKKEYNNNGRRVRGV